MQHTAIEESIVHDFSDQKSGESIFELLVTKNPNLTIEYNGTTASILCYTIYMKKDNFVDILLKLGANVNKVVLNTGETALHLAVKNDNLIMAEKLITRGININTKDIYGLTALNIAKKNKNQEMIQMLEEKGAVTYAGPNALFDCLMNGELDEAKKIIASGKDINSKNANGASVLQFAVEQLFPEIVQLLINNGADVNTKNDLGNTALDIIISKIIEKTEVTEKEKQVALSLLNKLDIDINIKLLKTVIIDSTNTSDDFIEIAKLMIEKSIDVKIIGKTILESLIKRLIDSNITDSRMLKNLLDNVSIIKVESLIYTIKKNRLDLARLLINKEPGLVNPSKYGESPLQAAIISNNFEAIELLLHNGHDVNVESLIYAIEKNRLDLARLLINKKPDIVNLFIGNTSPLQAAIISDNLEAIELLLNNGLDVNKDIELGRKKTTLLHWASEKGKIDIVRRIINNVHNIDFLNESYNSAIYYAIENKNFEIALLLLEKGASLSKKIITHIFENEGYEDFILTLIDKNFIQLNPTLDGKDGQNYIPLGSAIYYKNFNLARKLISKGAKINVKDSSGLTALHYAVTQFSLEAITLLLEYNADTKLKDKDGNTPLHLCLQKLHINLADKKAAIIKLANADKENLILKDNYGNTPLHLAAMFIYNNLKNLSLINFLYELKPETIDMKNSNGFTPIGLFIHSIYSTDIGQDVLCKILNFAQKDKIFTLDECLAITNRLKEIASKSVVENETGEIYQNLTLKELFDLLKI